MKPLPWHLIVVILLSHLAAPTFRATAQDGLSMEQLGELMTYHYLVPQITSPESIIAAFQSHDLYQQIDTRAPVVGMLSGLFTAASTDFEVCVAQILKLPPESQAVVLYALWCADNDRASDAFDRVLKSRDDAADWLPLTQQTVPDFTAVVPGSPSDLDFLWGRFIATGDTAYLHPIMEVLHWSRERQEGDTVNLSLALIGGAARWSLSANAFQHTAVFDACVARLASPPENDDEPWRIELTNIVDQVRVKRDQAPELPDAAYLRRLNGE